jgi:hypothetical protein
MIANEIAQNPVIFQQFGSLRKCDIVWQCSSAAVRAVECIYGQCARRSMWQSKRCMWQIKRSMWQCSAVRQCAAVE